VDHALPIPRDDVRAWRTAALVMTGVATIELLVLIVGGALVIGKPFAHDETATAATGPATAAKKQARPVRAILPRARTRVLVLNGNGETGAAATEADAIRARGYAISGVGNAVQPASGPSLVMYRPGFGAEAKRLARDTGIGIVSALDGLAPRTLHRAQVVIVIGTD
jgi:LytR cell envelope-related transcriptional attenuator